ncbi:MAG: peptide chain release factor-like protein [Pirellulaceae bacterium]|nr:peptide chain release factor-like protein [Pirellulaceae bacterium]
MTHPASDSDETLLAACELTFLRRSGPGGQHRNKTETAVVVLHRPTGLRCEANEKRSQAANRRVAFTRLRLLLAVELRHPIVDGQKASQCWSSRVHKQRLAIAEEHEDFPALLAEALDCIAAFDFQMDHAADRLLVTSSQLVKLLKLHRPAIDWVNRQRLKRDLRTFK